MLSARHESRDTTSILVVSTVKMVRGNERSNRRVKRKKALWYSPSRLGKAILAHYLTFAIRARQRLLEMDDCLAPPEVDAELSQHSALFFDQRPRSARAGRKWSTKNLITSTAHPYTFTSLRGAHTVVYVL